MDIVFIGNYTQDLIVKQLEKDWGTDNLSLNVHITGFNQYRQEIIDKDSFLYKVNPDVVFFSLDFLTLIEDIFYSEDSYELKEEKFNIRIEETLQLLRSLSLNLPNAEIFFDNLFLYRPIIMGTIEYNSSQSISEFQNITNYKLLELVRTLLNVKIIDVVSLVKTKGSAFLFDERMYYIAKSHWSFNGITEINNLYQRYLNAFIGKRKKCLILDLDNTLWGGIIGDEGTDNIVLSNDGPGKSFYDFQREILKLYERGILLAICSKNSKEIVLDAFDNHRHMILKKDHFVSMRINWNNKAQNIKEIAQEINIGLDSMVFLDDSPFERDVVSSKLPEVYVPELPLDQSEYPNFIRTLNVFDFLMLSKDDFGRNDAYKANVKRENLKSETINIEDFYSSLEMHATIEKISSSNIGRISQMTQKTNQFNLRTKRYNESEIKRFKEDSNYEVYQMSLQDKFGNNGIIACAIIKKQGKEAFIDTFILSCRAMGRTAETALINFISDDLLSLNFTKLVGEYIPTKKNMPCKDFYRNNGFVNEQDEIWSFNIEKKRKPIPWIKIN